jgi:hypothetical protein
VRDPSSPFFLQSTNSFDIPTGQTLQVISVASGSVGGAYIYLEKEGVRVLFAMSDSDNQSPARISNFTTPPTVVGPGKISLIAAGGGLATLRYLPSASDPQKTAIVLPGAENSAAVTMECSTDLFHWAPATNGVYSGDVAKFFRIHLEKPKP